MGVKLSLKAKCLVLKDEKEYELYDWIGNWLVKENEMSIL